MSVRESFGPAESAGLAESEGILITVEGPEGCGKSTQAALLRDALTAAGRPVRLTREPGGTAVGDRIRHLLLDPEGEPVTSVTELLLMAAARAQHVDEVLLPALRRGEIVICDRYVDSTTAYQGYGLGLDPDAIADLHRLATRGVMPAVTLLFDLDPAVGGRRKFHRAEDPDTADRIERRDADFHERVRRGYLAIAAAEPSRILVIDAAPAVDVVHAATLQRLRERLPQLWQHTAAAGRHGS